MQTDILLEITLVEHKSIKKFLTVSLDKYLSNFLAKSKIEMRRITVDYIHKEKTYRKTEFEMVFEQKEYEELRGKLYKIKISINAKL